MASGGNLSTELAISSIQNMPTPKKKRGVPEHRQITAFPNFTKENRHASDGTLTLSTNPMLYDGNAKLPSPKFCAPKRFVSATLPRSTSKRDTGRFSVDSIGETQEPVISIVVPSAKEVRQLYEQGGEVKRPTSVVLPSSSFKIARKNSEKRTINSIHTHMSVDIGYVDERLCNIADIIGAGATLVMFILDVLRRSRSAKDTVLHSQAYGIVYTAMLVCFVLPLPLWHAKANDIDFKIVNSFFHHMYSLVLFSQLVGCITISVWASVNETTGSAGQMLARIASTIHFAFCVIFLVVYSDATKIRRGKSVAAYSIVLFIMEVTYILLLFDETNDTVLFSLFGHSYTATKADRIFYTGILTLTFRGSWRCLRDRDQKKFHYLTSTVYRSTMTTSHKIAHKNDETFSRKNAIIRTASGEELDTGSSYHDVLKNATSTYAINTRQRRSIDRSANLRMKPTKETKKLERLLLASALYCIVVYTLAGSVLGNVAASLLMSLGTISMMTCACLIGRVCFHRSTFHKLLHSSDVIVFCFYLLVNLIVEITGGSSVMSFKPAPSDFRIFLLFG